MASLSCPEPVGEISHPPIRTRTTRRSALAAVAALMAVGSGTAATAAAAPDAVAFMNQLLNGAIAILNDKTSPAGRQAKFREFFQADFDGPGIARFVLGRYWRSASRDEQQEFLKLFEEYVVLVYSARLSDFSGERFKVRGSRVDQGAVIVSTDILSPGAAAPLKVDWRLVSDDGAFKISDVIVEGISMMVTERSEFASVIQRHGGQVSGLLSLMREKAASAAQ